MAGTTDTVPAMLTPGEFVIKQESAAMLGEPLLQKLNAVSDSAPQGYQVGGGVSQNSGAHGNIDALIGQAQLANMKPMAGGMLSMPFSLLANILNKPVPRTSTVLSPEEQVLMELQSGTRFPKTDVPSPEEEILNELISGTEQSEKDRPISSPFKGYENGGDVKRKTLYGVGGDKDEGSIEYDDDSYKYKRILSILADQVGGGEGLRYYSGEGVSDRLQSSKDQAGFDARQKMAFAPQDSIPFDMIKDYLKPEKKGLMKMLGFQEGGGVGEAGRQYPPGTLMSSFMGDQAPTPEAWMQPATESMPSPEEVAEFDRMIKTLQAQELLKKEMQKMQELGFFSDKEAIEYKEGDVLPPWQGKRNFKGNLYEDNIEFPVYREGNPQR